MLNIANLQGNVKVSPHTSQSGHRQKEHKTNVWEDVEKGESLYTAGGNVNLCSCYGQQYGDSPKN